MKYYASGKLSENIHETPEGYLLCVGVPIARTGEMEYHDGETPLETDDDGIILISRDEKEVFDPKTMASFEGKALTIKHPTEFVNPKNWSQLAKGHMQNVRRGEGEDKDNLIADILITDSMAISLVKNGLRGLSCGYEAEYTQTGKGKGKQTEIIGNHLALVEEGRAGAAYAITDAKGDSSMNKKFADRFKALLGKAVDESMKDADPASEGDKDKDTDKSNDEGAYDELMKMVKDLGEKIDGMKPKDDKNDKDDKSKDDDKNDKDDDKGEDDDNAVEDRIKALEAAVEKILEKMSDTGDDDDDSDVITDDDDDEDTTDDDDMGSTGDTASRAEILAPGIKASAKDIKAKALKIAYGTKDGKKAINSLTGGKPPGKDNVDMLFVAASELLKTSRSQDFAKTKDAKTLDLNKMGISAGEPMTAEKLNEINAKRYNKA